MGRSTRKIVSTIAGAFILVGLTACAARQEKTWSRIDGQTIGSSPAMQSEFQASVAQCRAAGLQAAAGVAQPGVTVNNTVNVGNSRPGGFAGGFADGLASGAAIAAANEASSLRRNVSDATMEGCMAQRGYLLAPDSRRQ